jgi:PKD repeat protein
MLLALNGVPAHAIDFADSDFERRDVVEDLQFPTDIAYAPDGRLFIAEQAGLLKVFNPGATEAVTVLDIRDIVGNQHDRGLLGIAIDSAYASNNYVYLLYVRDTGLIADDPGPMVSQLRRYTITPGNVVTGFTDILGTHVPASGGCPAPSNTLDCIPSDGASHSIGSVHSAPDGTLWLGSGDAADFGGVDPLALGTYDEQSFRGKIIHVDRDGNGVAGHQFCPADADLTHVCTKLFAKGFRNPFRFKLRPNGDGLAVADVGWNTREEIDLIPFDGGGKSYGWPCYEGSIQTPLYKDLPECEAEYAKPPGSHLGPAYDYEHNPPGGSAAVIAGPVYTGLTYPAAHQGRLFIADFATGVVEQLTIDSNDQVTGVVPFATDWTGVDLEQTPEGNIAWADPYVGAVYQAVYSPGNHSPTAAVGASQTSGPGPLEVQFFGDFSSDPDGDTLSFDWNFGDGSPHSSEMNPSHTFTTPGNYTVRLTVGDGRGGSDSGTVKISVGNTAPNVPTIVKPLDESLYRGGATVDLEGSATDPQDGSLTGSSLTWTVRLHHGSHIHPLLNDMPGSQQSFDALTDHDADSFYDVILTARDSQGLTSSRTIQIRPETVGFTLQSSPPGAPVSYGGTNQTAPFSTQAAVGFKTDVSAEQQFTQGGHTFEFDGWSDGGARIHNVTIPDTATTLTANYRDITPGSITIVKQTDPVGASDQFDFSGDLGNFSLTGASGGNSQTFPVLAGTYAVTEAAKAGWDLTLLACNDGSSTSGRTATIEVAPDEDVTCTFRNAKQGSVTIVKQTDPVGSSEQFGFTGGLGSFSLTGASGGNTHSVPVAPGNYPVTESDKPGWELSLLTCDDGSGTSGRTANVVVSAGENVSCTFRNTKVSTIVIEKQTEPDGVADQFDFAGSGPLGSFSLGDGQTRAFNVAPGSYSVAEQAKAGWDLSAVQCSDGSPGTANGVTIDLAAHETVSCVFTNVKRGEISIVSMTDPPQVSPASLFSFIVSPPLEAFDLGHGQSRVQEVPPGTYTVQHQTPSGYTLASIGCDDSDSTGSVADARAVVRLAAGERVACTFTAGRNAAAPPEEEDATDSLPVADSPPAVSLRVKRRRLLVGTVRDADGVESLDVAVARSLGKRGCRWWSRKTGRLAAKPRRCARPHWLAAELSGDGETRAWKVRLGGRLPRGRYRFVVLAVDALGNRAKLNLKL